MAQKWIFIFSFIVFLALSQKVFPETTTYSLSNVIDAALRNNLDIAQYRKDVENSEAQLKASWASLFLPQFSASGSFGYTDPNSVNRANEVIHLNNNQTIVITNNWPDSYNSSLNVSKDLFAGFKYVDAVKTQSATYQLARQKYEDKAREIKLSVISQFYQQLEQEMVIKAAEAADRDYKGKLDMADLNFKKNSSTEIDLLTARYNYKSNIPKLSKARHDYLVQKMTLCNAIGITNTDSVIWVGNLFSLTNDLPAPPADSGWEKNALSNDITYQTARNSTETARLTLHMQDWARYPSLSGSFSYSYAYKKDSTSMNARSWQSIWNSGLQLNIPLDSLLPFSSAGFGIESAKKTVEKLEIAENAQLSTVLLTVRTLIQQIQEYAETLDSRKDNLEIARLTLELTKQKSEAGGANSLDIADAEMAYAQALSDYGQSLCDYYTNYLKFKRLTDPVF